MANAAIDQNNVPTRLGTSNTDGRTPIRLVAHPITHFLHIKDDTTGTDLSDDIDIRDENFKVGLLAVSNSDEVTPTVVYADSSDGALLVDSN